MILKWYRFGKKHPLTETRQRVVQLCNNDRGEQKNKLQIQYDVVLNSLVSSSPSLSYTPRRNMRDARLNMPTKSAKAIIIR